MESSTEGTIKAPSTCNVTIVFGSTKEAPKVMLDDGKEISLTRSGDAFIYTFLAEAGSSHKLYKGNKGTSDTFLYAIAYDPIATGINDIQASTIAKAKAKKTIIAGRLIIENNGRQYNAAGTQVR